MSNKESAFDLKHIEDNAASEMSGVLDQLNLPPAFIDFLRKNQRKIWTVIGITAVIVTVVSLYGSYRSYTVNKAAKAYDQALLLEGAEKKTALETVAADFSSTASGVWSQVELARIDQEAGDNGAAITRLSEINSSLKESSLMKPLVLVNLGGLYEQENQLDQAVTVYQKLQNQIGFEAMAANNLGRVYEAQDKKDQARGMYNKYLSLTAIEGEQPQQDDPVRTMVKANLSRLQK